MAGEKIQRHAFVSIIIVFAIGLSALLGGCKSPFFDQEPDEDGMRAAYLASDGVQLGRSLLGETVKMAEFHKIGCEKRIKGEFRCRFFSKFNVNRPIDQQYDALSNLFGMASGFTREATFIRKENGEWICREVTVVAPQRVSLEK